MSRQQGFTIIELLIVVAVGTLLLAATTAYSLPMLARETMRSAIYDVQTYLQLARIEAVSRNRQCRFVLDTSQRTLRVFDTMGTGSTNDDEQLYERRLSRSISFAAPSGSPVTLASVSTNVFQTVFNSDGSVSAGSGVVAIFGGDTYGRVSLFVAGGLQVERWNGSAWSTGS
jgi:prepilin-type N-terminal cleavage/methylation domain-containing protein